jgi:hypothetical protein
MVVKDEYLQHWVFHFNPYTRVWSGFHRDHYVKYLNGVGGSNIYSAPSMDKLLRYIKSKHATT